MSADLTRCSGCGGGMVDGEIVHASRECPQLREDKLRAAAAAVIAPPRGPKPPTFSRLSKTGQPVMGSTVTLDTMDGGRAAFRVVGKLWGRKGSADLIGIVVELTTEPGARQTLAWPLEREAS